MQRWLLRFRGDRPMSDFCDRVVILVGDGLATGVTAGAAIRLVRQQRPPMARSSSSATRRAARLSAAAAGTSLGGTAIRVPAVYLPR